MTQAACRTTTNNQEAGRRKRHAVLAWLGRWHIATVGQLLRVSETTSKNFLYTMRKRNLLRTVDQQHVADAVMMLTPLGKALACELVPESAYYNTDISKVNHATLRHTVACQDLVQANQTWIKHATPEAFIQVHGTAGEKRPDILLQHNDRATTAVEVELTHKREDDIFRGYVAYLTRLHDQALSQVVYAFRTPAMRDRYRETFEAATWPLFERNVQNRWRRIRDIKGREHRLQRCDVESLLDRFRFQLIEDLIPAPMPHETLTPNLGPCPTRPRTYITAADWKAADPEAEPGQIVYVTLKQLFNPEPFIAKHWYQSENGREFAHVKTVAGRWRKIVLATDTGHCESMSLDEFRSLNLRPL